MPKTPDTPEVPDLSAYESQLSDDYVTMSRTVLTTTTACTDEGCAVADPLLRLSQANDLYRVIHDVGYKLCVNLARHGDSLGAETILAAVLALEDALRSYARGLVLSGAVVLPDTDGQA